LTIPCVVLSIVFTVLSAAWPDAWDQTARRVLTALMGTGSTILLSVLTLMKYQSKMDMFHCSAQCSDDLVSRLTFSTQYVFGTAKSLEELDRMAVDIGKKMAEIRSCAPPIPMALEQAARKLVSTNMEDASATAEKPKPSPPPSGSSTPPIVAIEQPAPQNHFADPNHGCEGGNGHGHGEPADVNCLAKVCPLPPVEDSPTPGQEGRLQDLDVSVAEKGSCEHSGSTTPPRQEKKQGRPQSWDGNESHLSSRSSDSERGGDWTL
jgi:hypothetical protein